MSRGLGDVYKRQHTHTHTHTLTYTRTHARTRTDALSLSHAPHTNLLSLLLSSFLLMKQRHARDLTLICFKRQGRAVTRRSSLSLSLCCDCHSLISDTRATRPRRCSDSSCCQAAKGPHKMDLCGKNSEAAKDVWSFRSRETCRLIYYYRLTIARILFQ